MSSKLELDTWVWIELDTWVWRFEDDQLKFTLDEKTHKLSAQLFKLKKQQWTDTGITIEESNMMIETRSIGDLLRGSHQEVFRLGDANLETKKAVMKTLQHRVIDIQQWPNKKGAITICALP